MFIRCLENSFYLQPLHFQLLLANALFSGTKRIFYAHLGHFVVPFLPTHLTIKKGLSVGLHGRLSPSWHFAVYWTPCIANCWRAWALGLGLVLPFMNLVFIISLTSFIHNIGIKLSTSCEYQRILICEKCLVQCLEHRICLLVVLLLLLLKGTLNAHRNQWAPFFFISAPSPLENISAMWLLISLLTLPVVYLL